MKTSQGEFDKFSESSDNEEEKKEKEKSEDKVDEEVELDPFGNPIVKRSKIDKETIKELERQRTEKLLEGRKLVNVKALGEKISQGVLH